MTADLLRISWPIVDPDAMPLTWLKAQATADLTETLHRHSLERVGRIGWHITHGADPQLTATCPVRSNHSTQSDKETAA